MSTVPNVATGSQLRPPARMRLCTRGRAPVLLRREVPVAGMASLVGCHADRRPSTGRRSVPSRPTQAVLGSNIEAYPLGRTEVNITKSGSGATGSVDPSDSSIRCSQRGQIDQGSVRALARAAVRPPPAVPWLYRRDLNGFLTILEDARKLPVLHALYASSNSSNSSNSSYRVERFVPFGDSGVADDAFELVCIEKRSSELMAHSILISRTPSLLSAWGRLDMADSMFTKAMRRVKSFQLFDQGEMPHGYTSFDGFVDWVMRVPDHTTWRWQGGTRGSRRLCRHPHEGTHGGRLPDRKSSRPHSTMNWEWGRGRPLSPACWLIQ